MSAPLIVLNHWLHLMAAIAAVGGAIFLRLAVHPSVVKILNGETRIAFERQVRKKATALVIHPYLLLLITGFINFANRFSQQAEGQAMYTFVFLLKFILAMAIFGIGIALLVPSTALEKFQERRPFWLVINILLATVVVLLSSWLRNMR